MEISINNNYSGFTGFQSGQYADGALGLEHVDRMACGLSDTHCGTNYVMQYRLATNTDELHEIALEALDTLNLHTHNGYWDFCDGDLILFEGDGED
jgi:hypothetical protein